MAVLNDLIVQGSSRFVGEAHGSKFIVSNGTSSQFMKADGSLDNTAFSSATEVNTALSNKTDTSAFTAHTADTSIHVTQALLDRIAVLENKVIYNGHQYVEIGGLKWATMNIGANSITDYGLYFQWGDAQGYTASQVGSGEGQKYFGWRDYKYCDGTSSVMTKYNGTDGKTVLDASDDAAVANWGGSWRMPTLAEFQALGAACDFIDSNGTIITESNKLTTLSGVTGILVADKNDHSKRLFFPAAGLAYTGDKSYVGTYGYYWSSSLWTTRLQYAFFLSFGNNRVTWNDRNDRDHGYAVRPVVG